MKTITTKRGKEVKLWTISEWFDIMEKNFGHYPGLAALEQAEFQSEEHKVCVECLAPDNLVHITGRALIKSTDYYMCQDCCDYYEEKNKRLVPLDGTA